MKRGSSQNVKARKQIYSKNSQESTNPRTRGTKNNKENIKTTGDTQTDVDNQNQPTMEGGNEISSTEVTPLSPPRFVYVFTEQPNPEDFQLNNQMFVRLVEKYDNFYPENFVDSESIVQQSMLCDENIDQTIGHSDLQESAIVINHKISENPNCTPGDNDSGFISPNCASGLDSEKSKEKEVSPKCASQMIKQELMSPKSAPNIFAPVEGHTVSDSEVQDATKSKVKKRVRFADEFGGLLVSKRDSDSLQEISDSEHSDPGASQENPVPGKVKMNRIAKKLDFCDDETFSPGPESFDISDDMEQIPTDSWQSCDTEAPCGGSIIGTAEYGAPLTNPITLPVEDSSNSCDDVVIKLEGEDEQITESVTGMNLKCSVSAIILQRKFCEVRGVTKSQSR